MDKYLVKSIRKTEPRRKHKTKEPSLKQARLPELKGVVVVEAIQRARKLLRDPNQNPDVMIKELELLNAKLPAVEILQTTKIGRTVKRLCSHADPRVSVLASSVVSSWSTHIRNVRSRSIVDVKCDGETERLRAKARQLLISAMQRSELTISTDSTNFLDRLEWTAFVHCQKRIKGTGYPKLIRNLVTKLKTVTESHCNLNVEQLVCECKK